MGTPRARVAGVCDVPATPEFVELANRELTLPNPDYTSRAKSGRALEIRDPVTGVRVPVPRTVLGYGVQDGRLLLPRYSKAAEKARANGFQDLQTDGFPVKYSFTGSFEGRWSYQRSVVDQMKSTGHGILKADCGAGKTVCAIALIAELGRTALVLVHTDDLREQWVGELKKFLGLKDSEIALIHGDRCDYQHAKVAIATLQSLSVKDYPDDFWKRWGVVVTDEVHRLGALVWGKAIQRLPARRRYGLTATVKRPDGMSPLIEAHVGGIVAQADSPKVPVKVLAVINNGRYERQKYTMPWGKRRVSYPKLLNVLADCQSRNRQLANLLGDCMQNGRRVLFVSQRISQLEALHQAAVKEGLKSGLLIAKTSKPERARIKEEADVLFVVAQYGHEALNVPRFDTLIMGTPIPPTGTALEQIVGRIQRHFPGKKSPVVIDMIDTNISELVRWWNGRSRWYRSRSYDVSRRQKESSHG